MYRPAGEKSIWQSKMKRKGVAGDMSSAARMSPDMSIFLFLPFFYSSILLIYAMLLRNVSE